MPFDTAAKLDIQQSIRIKELSGGVNVLNQQVAALSGITANATRLNVQLLGVIPAAAGQIYYTSEAIAGTGKGGGAWVAIADATTPDNGGTIRRPDANWIWKKQLQDGSISVMDFGATGLGVVDELSAINAAISAASASSKEVVSFPAGLFLISGSIVHPNGIKLRGAGSQSTYIIADFDGDAVVSTGTLGIELKGFQINPGQNREITGVHWIDVETSRMHDILVYWKDWGGVRYWPRIGFNFTGTCYYNKCELLGVIHFGLNPGAPAGTVTRGVLFDVNGTGNAPNTNKLHFTGLYGPECDPPLYDAYVDKGYDSAGMEILGNFNNIEIGEIANTKYPIINTGHNHYTHPSFVEANGRQPWNKNGEMRVEAEFGYAPAAFNELKIDSGIVTGPGGQLIGPYFQATNQPEISDSGCVALWTFDQASDVIIERMGNGPNLSLTGVPTLVRGLHRDVLQLSPTQVIDYVDMTALPLTSMFTIVYAVAVTAADNNHAHLAQFLQWTPGPEQVTMFLGPNGGGVGTFGYSHAAVGGYWGVDTMSYVLRSGAWTLHALWVDCSTGEIGGYDMGLLGEKSAVEGGGTIQAGYLDGIRNGTRLFFGRRYGDSGVNIMTCTFDMIQIFNRKLELREVLELSKHKRSPKYHAPSPTSDEGLAAPVAGPWPVGWYRKNVVAASGQPRGWYNTGSVSVPVWTPDINYP